VLSISMMVSMIRVGTLRIRQPASFCCWWRRKDWRMSSFVMNVCLLILRRDSGWRIRKRILSANVIEVRFASFVWQSLPRANQTSHCTCYFRLATQKEFMVICVLVWPFPQKTLESPTINRTIEARKVAMIEISWQHSGGEHDLSMTAHDRPCGFHVIKRAYSGVDSII